MHRRVAPAKAIALACVSILGLAGCEQPQDEPPAIDELSQNLPTGFTRTLINGSLSLPVGMAFAPDGRLFVIERGTQAGGTGRIRIVKNGSLLSTPFASIQVNNDSVSANERGLLGIAIDPNFATNKFVYVFYTTPTVNSARHNRVVRFTASGDVASGGPTLILQMNNLSAGNHNGGGLAFGKDGKLYIGTGDNAVSSNATNLGNYLGKVLRINPDGSAPSDNPFYNASDGITARDRIYTYGHRNVWRVAVHPVSGRIFANDVGQSSYEEINDLVAGRDYGWRGGSTDGDSTAWYRYDRGVGRCITGGTFYAPPSAPGGFSSYVGKYFFTDYSNSWIKVIDPANKSVTTFDTGVSAPTDIQVGPDGAIYYLATGAGDLYKVTSGTAPAQSLMLSDSALSINEQTSKAFTVRLAIQPSGNVTVNVARTSGDTTITASPATLTFTTSNWSTPQNVTVAAADDSDNTNETAVITVSSSGLTSRTVNITAVDNDVSGPLVQITDPTNGKVVKGSNAEFYGGSNLDGSTIRGEFYIDGALKYTDTGPGHYHFNGSHNAWDTTTLTEGTHTVRLTVYDAANRSGNHDVQVTVDNLPSPWNHQDIGAVGMAGGASAASGVFTVNGAGADVWGTVDEFQYVYQSLNGDGQIVARVTGVENTNAWAKAGVMIRASAAANSAHGYMLLSAAGKVSFQRRLATGGTSTATTSTSGGTSPLWVRLKRTGNTLTGARSSDGTNWMDVGSDSIPMGASVLVGLAVTGHADPTVATATFDNVTVSSGSVCTPETDSAFCARLAKNCGAVSGTDNCGAARSVASCGTCTAPATCGGGGTPNVCGTSGGSNVYTYFEAENGSGAGTAPLSIVNDANASGGKAVWSATVGSNLNPPADGHITFPFSVATSGTWKVWGRFLVGPADDSDDSLWVRIDSGTWTQWNNLFPRIGNTAYGWDSVHNTPSGDALVTYNLSSGNHVLEVAYRESGLKMDRFLVTNDLAFVPPGGGTCTPETNAQFCSRLGKNCGQVSGADNCGAARTVTSCGTCTSPQSCGGGGTPNVCGGGGCTPETNTQFCARLGKNCGQVTGTDNCGASRTVTSCGSCTSPQTCGGGGTPNVCGATSSGSCSFTVTQNVYDGPNWWGTISFRNDGPSASSNYQVAFDIPSGVQCDYAAAGWTYTQSGNRCTYKNPGVTLAAGASKTMNYSTNSQSFSSAGNVVVSDSTCGGGTCTPESNGTFCSRLGKNCGSVTGTDNCGQSRTVSSCGSCTSPQTCGGGGTPNVCGGGSCTPETNTQFCSRLMKNCGSVTGTDNCGQSRTVSSCGTCTSPNTCGGGGTPNVCGSGGNLVWRKANLTWYTSYPDPGSEECIKYNGCMWAGYFAFVDGKMTEEWVRTHNIAAIHEKDAPTYKLKNLRLKQGTKQIDVTVYDMCSDSDCSGCCTQNATRNGLNFLIDIESYTAQRFGTNSGIVDWACLNCN